MNKPVIFGPESTALRIADEAIAALDSAVKTIIQFEALFRVIRKEIGLQSDAARLLSLGEYCAMDQGNGFDCMREQLQERLDKCAPQNANSENVAQKFGGDE